MYRKDSQEWFKHIDFILLDLICLQAAFLLAYARKRIRVPSVPFDALSKCCGHSGVHRSVRHLLQQHHERRVEAWIL